MKLKLSDTDLFFDNEIFFDKGVNFVFGKNGTGKSTITRLIKEQYGDSLDIRIFQGFESIVGENNRLNAVTLGEENTSINEQIIAKEIEKEKVITKIKELSKQVEENGEENLYSKLKKINYEQNEKDKEINKFYSKSATKISTTNKHLVENARTYRKDTFKEEIEESKFLEKEDLEKYNSILKSDKKIAKSLSLPKIDFLKYQKTVNEILLAKVESKVILEELVNRPEKTNFADKGRSIHKHGEKCSFCGNLVTADRLSLLDSYFSADEVEALKKRIDNGKNQINSYKKQLLKLTINTSEFYPDFVKEAEEINLEIMQLVNSQISFLDSLIDALDEKYKNLFNELETVNLTLPDEFIDISRKYAELVEMNNNFANNLVAEQHEAMRMLRLNEVKKIVEEFKLETKLVEHESLIKRQNEAQDAFDTQLDKIKEERQMINLIDGEINFLKDKTKNTEKLTNNINNRLRYLVSFKLIRKKIEEQEFYEVQNPSGEIRSIDKLSTGEKNVIAFLYFIEKLSEISDSPKENDKIIIFDDPMTSNDDTMQYLIIDELQKVIKKCDKKSNSDKFILLTHNSFFYLNCSFDIKNRRDQKNAFEESSFYKLQRCNNQTKISKIKNRQQDFKTNYEALWHELVFLYTEKKPEMMLNPIRRIIETYIVFNGKEDFYKNNKDAKNLFNTNSHYFPDLEADLNGKSQDDIKAIMQKCFKDNGAENHFNKHWKNASAVTK